MANKPIPVSASATPSKKKTKSKIKKASSVKATLAPVKAKPVVRALWPVKAVYPNAGALLPFKRIVAYYGNFYSKRMGVLGEYSETAMLNKLRQEIKNWEEADPETSVIPGIDYIAVSAQGYSGTEGLYRFRMPDSQIDKAIELAEKVNGIVILDIQPGLSSVFKEVKYFEKYLKTSKVHLALDPEFNMRKGIRPGKVIGSLDASEINQVAEYLADLVKENNLTPKVLIIHRFTNKMVTNYKLIKPLPEVQIVMDMDGWGFPAKKINTHRQVIYSEPVQFTGFKLFYKNDRRTPNSRMMTPLEVLKLRPQPSFIQYQ
ncbi:hypothetical protein HY061_00470 [Candidatus Azambacteria bacterium]|nr:hypothetical protein [Candidatus Azambacteria bacterium]